MKKENFFWKVFGKLGQMQTFFIWTVLICFVSMLTSYFPLWVNVVVNVVLPLIVLFKLKTVMFERLKLSTLVIACLDFASDFRTDARRIVC